MNFCDTTKRTLAFLIQNTSADYTTWTNQNPMLLIMCTWFEPMSSNHPLFATSRSLSACVLWQLCTIFSPRHFDKGTLLCNYTESLQSLIRNYNVFIVQLQDIKYNVWFVAFGSTMVLHADNTELMPRYVLLDVFFCLAWCTFLNLWSLRSILGFCLSGLPRAWRTEDRAFDSWPRHITGKTVQGTERISVLHIGHID